tara:strand:- start:213 stop:941 length:729 start_codon:yes stop_codon:yes gene_type:complete
MDFGDYYIALENTCFKSSGMIYTYHDREWFRGQGQRDRAILDRTNKFGETNGIVLSMSEFKSNAQMSSVFPDTNSIVDFINKVEPEKRCFYELIENKSKLYFDVDISPNIQMTENDMLTNIYQFLKNRFNVTPNVRHVLRAHRKDKRSWHIIFPEFFLLPEDRRNLIDYILDENMIGVDYRVYNKTQPLRLQNCCIRNRPETVLLGNNSMQETMVTNIKTDSRHLKIKPLQDNRFLNSSFFL